MKRRAWPMALLGLLAGCGGLGLSPASPALYDLGPPAPGAVQPPVHQVLVLGRVDAAAPLDGTPQWYRLDYADGRQLRAYGLSRWSAPPPQLVRQRLKARLSRQYLVVEPAARTPLVPDGSPGGRVLRLELEEFAQRFDAAASSRGVIRLQASLWQAGPQGERLLARRSVQAWRPAPTPDAAGGTQALAAATDAAGDDLAAWLRSLD